MGCCGLLLLLSSFFRNNQEATVLVLRRMCEPYCFCSSLCSRSSPIHQTLSSPCFQSTNWSPAVLAFCYQFGVLVSRSSLKFFKVRRILVLTLLQAANMVFWMFDAQHKVSCALLPWRRCASTEDRLHSPTQHPFELCITHTHSLSLSLSHTTSV